VWNPRPNDWVLALAVRGDTVYAGGWFTGFGGVAHPYLAAIAPSGAISPWQGYAPGPVHALAPSGGPVLYAAMQDTSWVRALRTARTGAVWSARPTGYVHAVALDPGGSTVYADGTPGIVAIDATHGVIDPAWRPQPPPHNATSLAVTETAVFAADGSVAAFDRKDGHRHWLASVALGPRGALALALSPDGTRLYTAGAFVRIGAATRRNVAALDPRTGAVLSWKAALPGLVHALVATGSTLYAGGEFGVASIDVPTGAVKILDRPGEVLALALGPDGSALYAGGRFGLLRLSI